MRFFAGVLGAIVATGCGNNSKASKDKEQALTQSLNGRMSASVADSPALKSTVALSSPSSRAKGRASCSGTLVARRTVLTAAHCVSRQTPPPAEKTNDRVIFESSVTTREGRSVGIHNVVVHPEYLPNDVENTLRALGTMTGLNSNRPNDLAIVHLEEDAPSDFIPVQVASSDFVLEKKGKYLSAGYGITKFLTQNKPTEQPEDASNPLTEFDVTRVEVLSRQGLLRGHEAWSVRGTCPGDSGGSLYSLENGNIVLVGVSSLGLRLKTGPATLCAGILSFYTDVRSHSAWIREQLR
ncbi:MAG: trypsin-like serine protease [Silvanigrellales bacterium]|nr:trypsin-like serine protease [Silvanigrellales bacterium]